MRQIGLRVAGTLDAASVGAAPSTSLAASPGNSIRVVKAPSLGGLRSLIERLRPAKAQCRSVKVMDSAPKGHQPDSPGHRPGKWNVSVESPERAKLLAWPNESRPFMASISSRWYSQGVALGVRIAAPSGRNFLTDRRWAKARTPTRCTTSGRIAVRKPPGASVCSSGLGLEAEGMLKRPFGSSLHLGEYHGSE